MNQRTRITSGLERRVRGAFTLIEILLVIALIGLFTAMFVVNFDSLLRVNESQAVESAFWNAAREARLRALLERRQQWLRYDEKQAAFLVEESGGSRRLTFPIDRGNWDTRTRLEVRFQKRVPPNQFTLRQGRLIDVRDIAAAQFFTDGTCLPFEVSISINGERTQMAIDPWTGARLLEVDES